ncbi:hypothetical protein ONZ45_g8253 [Pleurotus djamor]|nr:hypothetical protein ONZ45_g8253 [Pleurotus djamor]
MHFLIGALLFGIQLAHATSIYLNPASATFSEPKSAEEATFALSQHLSLEHYEQIQDNLHGEQPFVGQGMRDALLLAADEDDAKAILPDTLQAISTLEDSLDGNPRPLLTTFVHRASESYSSVFASVDAPSTENLPQDFVKSIRSLSNFLATSQHPAFAAFDLSPLKQIRSKFGPQSAEYDAALEEARLFIHDAIATTETLRFALITYSSSTRVERAVGSQQTQSPFPGDHPPPPQKPIGSISTCFSTADACNNGTSSCSGRGTCIQASKAGRSCYVCTCEVTKSGSGAQTKTEYWAGESCEKKDVSGPFVLLTGTVITIILLLVGSVGLLSGVGSQELPSVLMGGLVGGKRD